MRAGSTRLFGSTSGIDPGFVVGGRRVPLNPDAYLAATFTPGAAGFPSLRRSVVVLDADPFRVVHVSNPVGAWIFR